MGNRSRINTLWWNSITKTRILKIQDQFDEGWWQKLSPFLSSKEFKKIGQTLTYEQNTLGKSITPLFNNTFRAFKECPYKDLKVVILGLDPYPQRGIADGLAFSVDEKHANIPPSIKFILSAMEKDAYGGFGIGYNENYCSTDLTRWANQGVLLLNCSLSTYVGKTGVHLKLWEPFIQSFLKTLRDNNTGIVYILLGSEAKSWQNHIDRKKNYILTASHPASCCYNGVTEWDCNNIFSKTNEFLEQMNGQEAKILW